MSGRTAPQQCSITLTLASSLARAQRNGEQAAFEELAVHSGKRFEGCFARPRGITENLMVSFAPQLIERNSLQVPQMDINQRVRRSMRAVWLAS